MPEQNGQGKTKPNGTNVSTAEQATAVVIAAAYTVFGATG